jgi:hypothetical protein
LIRSGEYPTLHVREIIPKDFYLAQVLRQKEQNCIPLVERVILNPEVVENIPFRVFENYLKWILENIFYEKIYPLEKWMEVSFHLCKQRWDQSMDWLEMQPISKITLMIEICNKFAEQQEDEMKKASRK